MSVLNCARALLSTALVFCMVVYAAEPSLTLGDTQRRALEHSRQLAAQDAGVAASREMAVAAAQLPDPVVKISIDNLPIDGPDRFNLSSDFMTMRHIGVMQEFTRADKRQLKATRFEHEAQRTLEEKMATSAMIERDAAWAWLDRYYLEAMAALVDKQIEQVRTEIQVAQGSYRGGHINLADVLMAKTTLTNLEDRASEIKRRRLNAKVALARWIGGEGADMLLGERPDIATLRWNTQVLHAQLAHHPQIAILEKQEQLVALDVQLAQANKKSDWSWEVGFNQRGPAYSNMISIGVSIPWQSHPSQRQDRDIAAKLAMLEQSKAQREDALRAHVAEVGMMINEWENDRERSARYARDLLPLADERTQAVMAAYRGGKSSLNDVLLARRNALDVRLQALQLEWDSARLWAQLNFLFPTASMASAASTVIPSKEDMQ